MSNQQRSSEPRVLHVEWQGRTKYTYYDDGIVKITRYKARKKIYWGRIFVALIVFILLFMGVVQLIKAFAAALKDDRTDIPVNNSMPPQTVSSEAAEESSSEEVSISAEESEADSSSVSEMSADYSDMGIIVCLDPGHGDYDMGTVSDDGTAESAQNLEISLLIKEYLEKCGVTVIMTRSTDTAVSLSERCTTANQGNADFFISLHRNSVTDSADENGVEIWVNNNQPEYDTALAQNIMSALDSAGISQNRGVKYGYIDMPDQNYQVNTDTVMPSCLVELGFVSSEYDNQLFEEKKSDYAKAIGNAVIQTAVQLGVVDESGNRLLGEQLISSGKTNVTESY